MDSPRPRGVSVSHYVVRGRRTIRADNDNPRAGRAPDWYWAIAIGALPTVCAAALLAIVF